MNIRYVKQGIVYNRILPQKEYYVLPDGRGTSLGKIYESSGGVSDYNRVIIYSPYPYLKIMAKLNEK